MLSDRIHKFLLTSLLGAGNLNTQLLIQGTSLDTQNWNLELFPLLYWDLTSHTDEFNCDVNGIETPV